MTFREYLVTRKAKSDATGDFIRLALRDRDMPAINSLEQLTAYMRESSALSAWVETGGEVWAAYTKTSMKAAMPKGPKARSVLHKEIDMIETNEPTSATSEHAKSPESDLVQTAREAGAAAQERLSGLRDAAQSTLEEARSTATEKVEETKELAAGEIARTAEGLHAAADKMEGSPFQQDLLREAADGLKQIAHAVEGKSIGTLAGDLSEFGRQNPVAYLGGAALVGFALARFARASTPAGSTAAIRSGLADPSRDRDPSSNDLTSADYTGGAENG